MSTPIRTLFVIGALSTGGSERQMLGILRRLDRSRFTPLLYVVYRRGELLAELPDDVRLFSFWDRHRYPRFNYPGRIRGQQARDLQRVIRDNEIDVVYDRNYFMTMFTALATDRCGIPRVSVVANDPANYLRETGGRMRMAKRWFLRQAYRSAFRVGAVSSGLRQSVIDFYGLPPDRVVTLPNFLDLERLDQLADQPAPNWASGRFHIAVAARLDPQKGLPFLLSAVEVLVRKRGRTELQLHIMGRGPEEANLHKWVDDRQLSEHVDFMGFVENPYPAMRQARLFCLPSLYEGNPNALVEAMACRVPVLATDCPSGPREILAGGRHGQLVPPADSRALADGIESAMADSSAWQNRVEPARQHIEEMFSPAAGIARLEEVLRHAARQE